MTIILNALRIRQAKGHNVPADLSSISSVETQHLPNNFNPYLNKYTQNNIFKDHVKKKIEVLGRPININGNFKKDYGLQLRQLVRNLQAHGAKVSLRIVDAKLADSTIIEELKENLARKGDYILVNYARKSLGQKGGGHISPLGAYDRDSDSFLIMDVNTNKAPWVWVKSSDLIRAMRTFDTVENRGYLLIKD